MCIICNTACEHDHHGSAGDAFLISFDRSRKTMKEAVDDMHRCSRAALTPEARKRYDRTHKKMLKIMRDWNRVEQEREDKHLLPFGYTAEERHAALVHAGEAISMHGGPVLDIPDDR